MRRTRQGRSARGRSSGRVRGNEPEPDASSIGLPFSGSSPEMVSMSASSSIFFCCKNLLTGARTVPFLSSKGRKVRSKTDSEEQAQAKEKQSSFRSGSWLYWRRRRGNELWMVVRAARFLIAGGVSTFLKKLVNILACFDVACSRIGRRGVRRRSR